ncbi:PadR family transcriptional regulator [Streptosporangium roseum]|uniref:Transcriptional regulator protein-like protein n=1 Tax=Streptosporangium roseum (strain ATCC 12428 / DSM 43021 / JCM 3005 / KCTC 9067 / NCIMB 10171 / NRRL 2505 / NI 9100) TaxID=479432 RepID=D2B049_STRRD|nr:PadR family transcriptional regulator [Streptosporangium roseum]ACZ87283.1 transcriptional regulator protein-like protein [Streptosporangium roseum DSM 43021]
MLELAVLGFLYDAQLHGYDLRRRIAALTGHVRPIADGTLYPLLKRMEAAGLLHRELQPGQVAAPRHMLSLTAAGKQDLLKRLREPDELFVTDENRWFTLLAFLRHLDDPAQQAAVLRRRLRFLTQPASFFWDEGRPLRAADFDDPFRQGLFTIATATTRTELEWLRQTLVALEAQA